MLAKIVALVIFSLLTSNVAMASEVKADCLFDFAGFTITNSMLTTWVFALVVIVLFRLLLGKGASIFPSKGQLVIEGIIGGMRNMLETLMGKRAFNAAFPLLFGFFAFILIMNWSGLLPGVGSVGLHEVSNIPASELSEYKEAGFKVVNRISPEGQISVEKFVPYVRPANSDLNTTLALSIISFGAWFYFVLKYAGPKVLIQDIFGNKATKGDLPYAMYLGLFVIFFAVGCIDLVSIVMRLLSLSFRLFGNNFGGEVLLENMHHLAGGLNKYISWIIPLPFYLLELLIGFIQACLFTLLTAVYIGLLTSHQESEH